MEFSALEIATFLNGEIIGDPNIKINNVSKIEDGKPGTLSFLANLKYESFLYETNASVVLINADFVPSSEVKATLIKVKDAYAALSSLLDLYVKSVPEKRGIEQPNFIDQSARIDDASYLGAFCYIGKNVTLAKNVKVYPHTWIDDNCIIGDNTILYSGVKLYAGTQIGNNCVVHAGAVIGADGFGFAPLEDGSYKKIQQIGNVIIEDNVEVGANSTIDRATLGATRIKKGVKIDNLVQVAHNVVVGENTVMAAQFGVAGSTSIGQNCVFGGQAGVAGHLKVGNNVTMAAKTGATNNIKDNTLLMGAWGIEASRFRRAEAVFRNLPELVAEVNNLKKEIRKIKNE